MDLEFYTKFFEPESIYYSEMFLQEIWFNHLWKEKYLTLEGESVQVLTPGIHNKNEGSDFKEAQMYISDKLVSGDIEIHFDSQDWYYHKHHLNDKYNNVILHIVFRKISSEHFVRNKKYIKIPILYIPIESLSDYPIDTSCNVAIKSRNELFSILMSLGKRRVDDKVQYFLKQSQRFSFELMLLWGIFKACGYRYNQNEFIQLFLRFPWKIYFDFSVSELNIREILFGLANLEAKKSDDYHKEIQLGWEKIKVSDKPVETHQISWTYSKSRPLNYPDRRLAWLALFLEKIRRKDFLNSLFEDMKKEKNWNSIFTQFFEIETDDYWAYHYRFGLETDKYYSLNLGKTRRDEIILNTLLPLILAKHLADNTSSPLLENEIQVYYEKVKLPGLYLASQKFLQHHNVFQGIPEERKWLLSQGILYCKTKYCSQALYDICPFCGDGK